MKNFIQIMFFCFAYLTCLQVYAQNTSCSGSSTEADEGSFSEGYTYSFTTSGTNVIAVFELKEAKEGLVAFAQTYNPNFAERPMTAEGGQKFSATFTNQTAGSTFKMRCKFAFAGGLATTKIFEYTVGEDCGVAILDLPVTFDNASVNYELVDFGGNASEITDDPTNPSNKVVRSIKTAAAEVWAGSTVGDEKGLAKAIPFMAGSTSLSVRVWSPTAGTPIRLKVENAADGNIAVETEALTTVAEQWETLIFNFANHVGGTPPINFAKSYNKISIFFNFGTSGANAGAQTYYWDDIQFIAGDVLDLPLNFENENINYDLADFGGITADIVVDPTDANNRVVRIIKTATAVPTAGVTIGGATGFASKIPFASGATRMSVRIWSPDADVPIRLKVENAFDPTKSVEVEVRTTLSVEWETLLFDFANEAQGTAAINFAFDYNKATLFFNFGTAGEDIGEKIYYFDDMIFIGGSGAGDPDSGLPVLPLDFESDEIEYDFVNFDGGELTRIANPQSSGSNASGFVGRMVKNEGQPWAGSLISLASPIDFTKGKTFKVKVFMPREGAKLLLKVENQTNGAIAFEREVTATKANEWEELTFDYSGINTTQSYQKLVFIFDLGIVGDGSANFTYLLDDVTLVSDGDGGNGGETPTGQMNLPVTFDQEGVDYGLVGFGGTENNIVADPTNANNMVARVIKTAGAEGWAGTTVTDKDGDLELGFSSKVPFTSANTRLNVRVWSPDAGIPVRLKIENHLNNEQSVETEAVTTVAGQWETLTFDFANQAIGTAALDLSFNMNKASIFFNFGTTGEAAGEKTYYFDDMRFGEAAEASATQMNLPVTFDEEGVSYGLVGFGGTENTIVEDPTNASNMVARVVKTGTAEGWAGTTVTDKDGDLELGFSSKVPFTSDNTRLNVRVWSPDAGIPVRLKIENHLNNEQSVETEAVTMVAGQWETLTFDFANEATGTAGLNLSYNMNKASIFFNFGTSGETAGEKTYYFDDLRFGAAEGGNGEGPTGTLPTIPLDFESEDLNYEFLDFEGGVLSRIANPQINESNPSAFVARMVKNEGAVFAGSVIPLATPIDFSRGKTFSVKVFMPRVGAKMLLKVENQNNGEISFEREVTGTKANEWEEILFNFTDIPTDVTYQKVVIIFDLGTSGDGSANFTYLLDDIALITDTSSESLPVVPLDFESDNFNYEFIDFEGGVLSRIANPQISGINLSAFVGEMVKNEGAVFAGSVIPLAAPIDFNQGKNFNVKVFMPRVGAKLLLKVENQSDPNISFEKEVTGTKSNEWEELIFDYSDIATDRSYQKIVLIFDLGTSGDGSTNFTYLLDDIRLVDGEAVRTVQMNLPVTFNEEGVNYGLVGFEGAEASTIVVDPTNAANRVARVIKSAGAQPWAGTTVTAVTGGVQSGFSSRVPFTASEKLMSVRVWSPDAGIPVRLKVENHLDPNQSVETEATTTVAGQWETLTFDFANHSQGTAPLNVNHNLNKATIFFNFGTAGAAAGVKTYYFDGMTFGTPLLAQTITFPAIETKSLGAAPFALNATSSSELPITYAVNNDRVTINGGEVTIVRAGSVTITAGQQGNATYAAASSVSRSFCITPAKPEVTISGQGTENIVLTSNATEGNQWYLNGEIIPSATQRTLTVRDFGIFTVRVSIDDCLSSFSDEVVMVVNGTEIIPASDVKVYPNPTVDYIEITGISNEVRGMNIIDMGGRPANVVFYKSGDIYRVNLQDLAPGVYILWIQERNKNIRSRIIKK